MSNPLSRLLGQAEVSVADFGRRTIESVTTPIRIKSQEIVSETVDTISVAARAIVIKGVLALVAAAMAIVAIVYLLGALFDYLLPILGPVETRLVMAAMFAVVAIVAILAMVFWPKGKPSKASVQTDAKKAMVQSKLAFAEAKVNTADAVDHAADAAKHEVAAKTAVSQDNLKAGFETIVSVLGDAGFRREQAGLKAGLALASQLKPMQIVSLALLGGFVAGLRSFPRRR